MRLPHVRCRLRWLMGLTAVVGLLLGAERFWRRSEHFRKQAALCAYFELQCQWYANTDTDDDNWQGLTIEEKRETARQHRLESRRFGALKEIYRRMARHPWESLPLHTPDSVNAWDLKSLSASQIEGMVENY